MTLLLAVMVGVLVLVAAGVAYAMAVRRIPGVQPGEEEIDALIARAGALGFRLVPAKGPAAEIADAEQVAQGSEAATDGSTQTT
ncbi:MAG: hypothetical protein IT519_16770 [Burkholderiales bacterium]|nr:hypothetical protein [Burkholderiales bacterium]